MCRWWCLCHVTIQGSNMVAAADNWSCYIESDKLVSSKQQDCRGVEEASVATIHHPPSTRPQTTHIDDAGYKRGAVAGCSSVPAWLRD